MEAVLLPSLAGWDFAAAAVKLYVSPGFLSTAEFGKMIAAEDAYLARVMEQIGLKKSP